MRYLAVILLLLVPLQTFAAFPTTSIIDDFDRANETPLSGGGNWPGPIYSGLSSLNLTSNQVTGAGADASRYYTTSFGPDSECYFDIPTGVGTNQYVDCDVRIQTPNTSGIDSYVCAAERDAGAWDNIFIYEVTNGSFATLATASVTFAGGDSIGCEIIGSAINLYRKPSGGSWGSIASASDSTISGAGVIGAGVDGTTARIDNFGGGTVVAAGAATITLPALINAVWIW